MRGKESMQHLISKAIFEGVGELLYPKRCPVCERVVGSGHIRACGECREELRYCEEPLCMRCGRPLLGCHSEYCDECQGRRYDFDRGFSLFQYDALVKRMISDFKFNGRAWYADFFAEELVKRYGKVLLELKPDLLVPVPIHKSKLKIRGFNQAQLLSERISSLTGIESVNLLIRTGRTKPQKELGFEERRKNLNGAFELDRRRLRATIGMGQVLRTVVLVDDIYTTGATLNECARILKAGDISKVYFLSLSIGRI